MAIAYANPDATTVDPLNEGAPVTCTFLETLFGDLRDDTVAPKQGKVPDFKDIKKELGELSQRIVTLKQSTNYSEEELDDHLRELLELWDDIEDLRYRLEDLDNRSRQSNIQIKGVPLQADAGKLEEYVLHLFKQVAPASCSSGRSATKPLRPSRAGKGCQKSLQAWKAAWKE
ncbi:hypothetical protein NDU88_006341 [Pleurodeles waltl]|uniref:Uncharacterized protein n=1 Tax=Pleurodeles waltl TaxID=8319 RepID=A0AAV7MFG9_PLEWA|nr:hypothetical protein NDU88_006341 [Pleurodeles waltl]